MATLGQEAIDHGCMDADYTVFKLFGMRLVCEKNTPAIRG
jgi:hypothetical protein